MDLIRNKNNGSNKNDEPQRTSIDDMPNVILNLVLANFELNVLDFPKFIFNKKWQVTFNNDWFWEIVYNKPVNQAILHNGQLWKILLQHTSDPNATIDTILSVYLQQAFNVEAPQGTTVAQFFSSAEDIFLGKSSRKNNVNYMICGNYLKTIDPKKPRTAIEIVEKIKQLYLALKEFTNNNKTDLNYFEPNTAKKQRSSVFKDLNAKDYKKIINILLQLRQCEQILTVMVVCSQMKGQLEPDLYILTKSQYLQLLTLRGISALESHFPHLNPGACYEKVFYSDLPEEKRNKHPFLQKENIPQALRKYHDHLKQLVAQSTESELLNAFTGEQGYLLLVQERFIDKLSNKNVILVALQQKVASQFLFESRVFLYRLKDKSMAETLLELAMTDANTALLILKKQALASRLTVEELEEIIKKYDSNNSDVIYLCQLQCEINSLDDKSAEKIMELISKKPPNDLMHLAIANTDLSLAAIKCLSTNINLTNELSVHDVVKLFNYNNTHNKDENSHLFFLDQLKLALKQATVKELYALSLTEDNAIVSQLAAEQLLPMSPPFNDKYFNERRIIAFITRYKEQPFFKKFVEEKHPNLLNFNSNNPIIKNPALSSAFERAYAAHIALPNFSIKTNSTISETSFRINPIPLMQSSYFRQHLTLDEWNELSDHMYPQIKQMASSLPNPPKSSITRKLTSKQLEGLETRAEKYSKDKNRCREHARLAWLLCAAYASSGKLDKAEEWIKISKQHLIQPPIGIPRIVTLIDKLSLLPEHYKAIREQIKVHVEKGSFNAKGNKNSNAKDDAEILLDKCIKRCKQLGEKNQRMIQRTRKNKTEIDKAINYFTDQKDVFIKKTQECKDDSEKHILEGCAWVTCKLKDDIENTYNRYCQQDFSVSQSRFKKKDIYDELEYTIKKYVKNEYALNLFAKEPEEKDIMPGNIYLYKEYQNEGNWIVKAKIADYSEYTIKELDLESNLQKMANELSWQNNKNVFNARDDKSTTFLNKLQLDNSDKLVKNSPLLKYRSFEQIAYKVLSALTWIFFPYSLYKGWKTGTPFYFHANDDTESQLTQKILPSLKKAFINFVCPPLQEWWARAKRLRLLRFAHPTVLA